MKHLSMFLLLCSASVFAGTCDRIDDEKFSVFFNKFSHDKEFSMKRTTFPLRVLKWEYGLDENGKDESAPVVTYVSKAKYLNNPTISEHMQENKLEAKIKKLTGRVSVVEIYFPDSSWVNTFHFRRIGHCWNFHELQDHSL